MEGYILMAREEKFATHGYYVAHYRRFLYHIIISTLCIEYRAFPMN